MLMGGVFSCLHSDPVTYELMHSPHRGAGNTEVTEMGMLASRSLPSAGRQTNPASPSREIKP